MDIDRDRFGGIGRLYGDEALGRLASARVAVVGIGGVGSWTAEALARSGVGAITLIDLDDICVTNTNRQLHTTGATIGRLKVAAMAERLRQISPAAEIDEIAEFVTAETLGELIGAGYTAVVDAIDQVPNKANIVARCLALGIGVVTVGGAGGRRDPTKVRVGDLARTAGDPLLREVRRRLRAEHSLVFAEGADTGIRAVYSEERAVYPAADGSVCEKPADGKPLRLDCRTGFGTAAMVTGAFGLAAAAAAVDYLTGA
jgi:tRNA A37 threonylcarbamoyladenosine dehydratase